MSAAPALPSLAEELAAIAGPEFVNDDAGMLRVFAVDGIAPAISVSPGSAEEVAAILRLASARDLVVVPCGGFTHQDQGGIPKRADVLLKTGRLRALRHYDAGDLTLGADAGMTLAEVERTLAVHRQFLPLEVARPEASTLGGALAVAAHGPLRHAYGGVRDFCIGITFVTGDGKIAHGGGRVVKNVAGYDLMKLLVGSFGTLGVIVGASFKVFPRPSASRSFLCEFPEAREAAAFRDRVLRSPLRPECLEVLSPRAAEYLKDSIPGAESKAVGRSAPEAWRVALRAAGSEAVLARYARELGAAVSTELEGQSEAAFWRSVITFSESVEGRHHNAMILHLALPIAAVAAALAAAEQIALDHGFLMAAVGRAGAGALVVALIPILVDPPAAPLYAAAVKLLRLALPHDATAAVARCPREAKSYFSVWGTTPTELDSMRGVQRALDPKSVLNRGRFML